MIPLEGEAKPQCIHIHVATAQTMSKGTEAKAMFSGGFQLFAFPSEVMGHFAITQTSDFS